MRIGETSARIFMPDCSLKGTKLESSFVYM